MLLAIQKISAEGLDFMDSNSGRYCTLVVSLFFSRQILYCIFSTIFAHNKIGQHFCSSKKITVFSPKASPMLGFSFSLLGGGGARTDRT